MNDGRAMKESLIVKHDTDGSPWIFGTAIKYTPKVNVYLHICPTLMPNYLKNGLMETIILHAGFQRYVNEMYTAELVASGIIRDCRTE